MKKLGITLIAILALKTAFSQATIKGKITDFETGEELIGATVLISGTTKGAISDLDGNYILTNAPSGKTQLVCMYISYQNDTINIEAKEGEVTIANVQLKSSAITFKTFEITAKANRASENYMLKTRQKSATVMEGITTEEIAKRGDNTVAAAAKRVTGVTIEGGKYIYVRGLSDRYSLTTLNNAEIPGLDPNRNGVQLDLFPTNLIQNITIVKSFTPDLPASFTGGLVNIETRDFPESMTFQYSSSLGYNSQASFNPNFLTYKGGKWDNLGFDDGTRDSPNGAYYMPALFKDNTKLETITKSFNKEMAPSEKTPFLNQRHSASFGNSYMLGEKNLGVIFGLSYSKQFQHLEDDAVTNRYTLTGNVNNVDELNPTRTLNDIKSEENVLWGALANVSLKISKDHKIGFTFIRNQNGISSTSFQQGEIPEDQPGLYFQTRALEYQERAMSSYQLKGEHYFEKLKKLKADWMAAYSNSSQYSPDLRYFSNDFTISDKGDTSYNIQASIYPVPTRYYRDLKQSTIDAKINFEFVVAEKENKISKIKFGAANIIKSRDFTERRYNYRSQGSVPFNGNVTNYLSDKNMNLPKAGNPSSNYIYMEDATEKRNSYTGSQNVFGAYLMGDVWATQRLRLIGGARLETTLIEVISADTSLQKGLLDNTDVLPSLNLTYSVKENHNLRFAYTRTLARPTFREVAPFAMYDFSTNWIIVGNPNLKRTLVDNIDLRYEIFPKPGEIISVGGYYKRFTDPIEIVTNIIAAASSPELTWRNLGIATLYGVELEYKKVLEFISDSANSFYAGGNFTYVKSEVNIDEQEMLLIRANDANASNKKTLFGQSPYVINAFFGYSNSPNGISANVNYNVSGEKLIVVIIGATPDVFAKPVHQLDFNISKKLGKKKRFDLKLTATNLINPIVKQTYTYKGQEYIFNSYRNGRTYSFKLSYLIK